MGALPFNNISFEFLLLINCNFAPLAHDFAVNFDTGKPFSANLIAGSKISAKFKFPHFSMVSTHPAAAPGTVIVCTENLCKLSTIPIEFKYSRLNF